MDDDSQKRKRNTADDLGVKGTKKGRAKGVGNYSEEELSFLLELVAKELPVGAKGWSWIGARLRIHAKREGWTERSDKSIENKFKQASSCVFLLQA